MADAGLYEHAWSDLKRRNRILWILFLTYLPGVLTLTVLAHFAAPDLTRYTPLGPAILWSVAFVGAGIYRSQFRCPRCRKRYFATWWYQNSLARKCVHCRLPRWTATAEAAESADAASRVPRIVPAGKLRALRAAYWMAAVAASVMCWLAVSGRFFALMAGMPQSPIMQVANPSVLAALGYVRGVFAGVLVGVLLFLSARPYWWGKVVCLFAGLSWMGFAASNSAMAGFTPTAGLILAAGFTMLMTAIVHHVVDSKWDGSYLRRE